MGKLAVSQFVSVDGVIEDPVGMESLGRGDWTSAGSFGDEGNEFVHAQIRAADAFLMGRRTYEGYVAAWPERDGEYADKLNAMPKYVVSSTLSEPPWNNTTVIAQGLIDEWRLIVFPILVGKGKRLFGDPGHAVNLRLTDSRKVGDGVQLL